MGSIQATNGSFEVRRSILLTRVAEVRREQAAMWAALRELEGAVPRDATKVVSMKDFAEFKQLAQAADKTAKEREAAALAELYLAESQAKGYEGRAKSLLQETDEFVDTLHC
jgi:hypothetical protein